uniref:Uncharacterized protein n=1 Tax=Rhizophagus irregularis (strain DAOM 181602 / DAOM 197198 / MUCL 43194) TaxID=747089 RepID=U9T8T9_RHIID
MYLEKNEDDDHIIYCQQLKDKWLTVANNTRYECKQILKDLLSQENYLQLNQEDIQQSMSWNRNFFVYIIGSNQELPIPFIHLILRNFFPKEKYRKLKSINHLATMLQPSNRMGMHKRNQEKRPKEENTSTSTYCI